MTNTLEATASVWADLRPRCQECRTPATIAVLGHCCGSVPSWSLRCDGCFRAIPACRAWCTACGERMDRWYVEQVAIGVCE